MRVRGRYLVIAWTAVFLASVGAIVFRAKTGFDFQRSLTAVNDTIRSLEAIQGDVSAQIETLKSRPVLMPKVEAMGLRVTSDTEFRLLPVPTGH